MDCTEKRVSSEIMFKGRIITVRKDKAELVNGHIVTREVVEHDGGVAVVPIDADGCVIAVRQFRYPFERELLEVPAGKLENGEDPLECAKRELSEETGYTAGRYVYLGPVYPSPGFCKEILYIYLAADLVPGEAHPDDDEFLNVERIPLEKLSAMIADNTICDAKTIIGVLKAENFLKNEK